MISESERRLETFQEQSEPVVLSDGQTWHLAKPKVKIRAVFNAGKVIGTVPRTTFGNGFDEVLAAVDSVQSIDKFVEAVSGLAAVMLQRNYRLSDDEIADLLIYETGDGRSQELFSEILMVARGLNAPKASPAGSI